MTIDAGGYLLVFASSKESAGTELHASFSLSEDETLYLYAPENYLADSAPNVSTKADHSSVRRADGSFGRRRGIQTTRTAMSFSAPRTPRPLPLS